jgi:hypothetical protein
MMTIGCDFHTRYQQIAMLDQTTGELTERRLEHERAGGQPYHRGERLSFAGAALFAF